ncbi:hypothetical protein GGX14DRAFT_405249 [Mycena pura]|uniref:Uncharacterized protein n=1 Tax=Mycena pura TaxID=153505 RepID=A0AAD6USJ3_9AGAR|nr:hypothetical protein GGX14DRAFT_405249 [Mycena pura]
MPLSLDALQLAIRRNFSRLQHMFGQSPNREPELGVQFSLVQVRTEIRTELARHYAFESDRGRAATRDGWGESSYLKGSRNSFDRQRKGGTPEILGCHVVGRAAFGDAAVELARKLRKASPVFSWDTARAPGPEEVIEEACSATSFSVVDGRNARRAWMALRECAWAPLFKLGMQIHTLLYAADSIELTSKHIRAFTARWGLELGRFYLKLVNGSCRLAIEVQVVSSGWRPAERAPQHALKRRKQRATRASLQTLAAPHAVPPRVTCNHPARRARPCLPLCDTAAPLPLSPPRALRPNPKWRAALSNLIRTTLLDRAAAVNSCQPIEYGRAFACLNKRTLRNVQYREMQYRRALFMLKSGHIPYFTKRPLPLDPPPSSMSSRDYLVSEVHDATAVDKVCRSTMGRFINISSRGVEELTYNVILTNVFTLIRLQITKTEVQGQRIHIHSIG